MTYDMASGKMLGRVSEVGPAPLGQPGYRANAELGLLEVAGSDIATRTIIPPPYSDIDLEMHFISNH